MMPRLQQGSFAAGAVLSAFAALAFVLSAGRAAADYRIGPGDVVEVAIAGLTDQRQRATVQLDGTISLPGTGAIAVAGLSAPELQARMEALLPTKLFKVRAPDGRERVVLVRPADVTAVIAEYRPVYVTGDVLTPGQQTYRPQMTVRQVVAVAGGYSLLRARTAGNTADPVEIKREYELAAIDYAREFFRIARTQAAVEERDTFEPAAPRGLPVPDAFIKAIVQSEQQALRIEQAEHRAERQFLEDSIRKAEAQIAILKRQEQGEASAVTYDEQDLSRVQALLGTGAATNMRVIEARRALLLSSTRRLQTAAELMRVERQQDEYRRQLERLDNQRRTRLLTELADGNARLAAVRARLHAATERLHPLRLAGPAPTGAESYRPEITVVRKNDGTWVRISAKEDFEVEPGDVIEITLRIDMQPPSQ
ncbi:MAG TPA: polysaccharide biosynthesis/export family protein [Xanthobacteraceae bacterium]|nr:polysaccharide biosynthesis/export family protein [Xanthobacteraceae bacterium]